MSAYTVQVKNRNLVEAIRDSDGLVKAKAYRTSPDEHWFIGRRNPSDGQFYVVGTLGQPLPEVLQRKAIIQLLGVICLDR